MTTARPWKNLRRAFNPSVGTCLSAASSKSVATVDICVPFGKLGILGNDVGKVIPSGPADVSAKGDTPFALPPSPDGVDVTVSVELLLEFPVGISITGVLFRGRNRRDLASCLFQPATLIIPSSAQ